MTIEAKSKVLGIPFLTRELTHINGETWLGFQKEIDLEGETQNTPRTFRVLSDDQLVVYRYYPEIKYSSKLVRWKPDILTQEEINDAKLHTNGIIFRVDLRWKPTK